MTIARFCGAFAVSVTLALPALAEVTDPNASPRPIPAAASI